MNRKLLSAPFIFWSVLFILVPLGMVFYYGLTDKSGALTLENIAAIATPEHSKALWESVKLSLISTVICFLLAYPLAMILCGMHTNKDSFIVLIFILPMWMNFLLRTLAWQTLLEKTGVINSILNLLHLPSLNIINTPGAIILGMVYNFLPFMVLPIYNVLVKIDVNVVNAARDLGANSVQTFFKIIFPQMCKRVLPPVTNEIITLVKDTSLAFVLAYTEMFTIAKQVAAAQSNIMPLFIAGVFYYIFNLVVAGIMGKVEQKLEYYQ